MGNRARPWNKRKTIPSPNSNTQTTAHVTKDEAGIGKPPIPPSQPQEKHWDTDEREHHRIERRYWGLTALLTFIAVLGAVATTVLSKWSLDESQQATSEARRATSEAHRQADAVEKQTRISVRPCVGLTDDMNPIQTSHVSFNKDGDAQVTYAIISKNYSNSAATGVTEHAQLLISEDIPYIFGAALDEACSDNYVSLNSWGGSVLFPGKSQHVIKSTSSVNRSDIKAGTEGNTEAWLVGCIGYRDQFSVLYKTKFVYWYTDPSTSVGIEFYPSANAEIVGQFIENHSSVQ